MFVYEQSFQGKRHFQKGVPCQDRCGHCFTPNGWVAAAVADGVSASPLSEVGASIAVNSCLEYLSEFKYSPFLDAEGIHLILRDAFNYALRRIKESDDPESSIPFSKITTLQVFLYHQKIGLHWGQAGDGALIVRNAKGDWKQITFPMKNKEDNSSPVTLQDGAAAWRFGSIQANGLESILLTTDGVAEIVDDGADDKETSKYVINYLMNPPPDKQDKRAMDSYYDQLFYERKYGENSQPGGGADTALARLSSITDDITILLVKDLLPVKNPPDPAGKTTNQDHRTDNSPEGKAREHTGKTENPVSKPPSSPPFHSTTNTFEPVHRRRSTRPPLPESKTPIARTTPANNSYSSGKRKGKSSASLFDQLLMNKKLIGFILLIILILVLLAYNLLPKGPSQEETNIEEPTDKTEILLVSDGESSSSQDETADAKDDKKKDGKGSFYLTVN